MNHNGVHLDTLRVAKAAETLRSGFRPVGLQPTMHVLSCAPANPYRTRSVDSTGILNRGLSDPFPLDVKSAGEIPFLRSDPFQPGKSGIQKSETAQDTKRGTGVVRKWRNP
jgi:hypothetical protein